MSSTSEFEPENEPTSSEESSSSNVFPAAKRRKFRAVVDDDDCDEGDVSSATTSTSVKTERPAWMPLTTNWEVNGDEDEDFAVVGVLGHTWERAKALRREARRQTVGESGRAPSRLVGRVSGRVAPKDTKDAKQARYKNTKHKKMKEKIASRHDQTIVVETPSFGNSQVFTSWTEFWSALADFMVTHFVVFRKRTSQTARKNNEKYDCLWNVVCCSGNELTTPCRLFV
jgi:hypothetical protein